MSKYQGTIDWGQVKASGVDFAMVRVGYRAKTTGILYEDPGARYNLQEANANGIQTGAYFFSSAVTQEEAREEAEWVASFIAKYKITYPVEMCIRDRYDKGDDPSCGTSWRRSGCSACPDRTGRSEGKRSNWKLSSGCSDYLSGQIMSV